MVYGWSIHHIEPYTVWSYIVFQFCLTTYNCSFATSCMKYNTVEFADNRVSYNTIILQHDKHRKWGRVWTYKRHPIPYSHLTHWGQDKMAAIPQMVFSNAFSWLKMCEYPLIFTPKGPINNIQEYFSSEFKYINLFEARWHSWSRSWSVQVMALLEPMPIYGYGSIGTNFGENSMKIPKY